MGYNSSSQAWGTPQLAWNAHHLEDSALVLNDGNTKPITMMMGGVYRSSLPTYTNGDAAVMHFSADGKLMVDTELTLDGNLIIDNLSVWATNIASSATAGFALIDASGHPQVDVMTMPGSLTGYAEDSVHNSGDIGIMNLAVRNDGLAALGGTDGDYAPLQVDGNGALFTAETARGEHDAGVSTVGPQIMAEAKDFDGAALPNTVQEGDAVRPAASLAGVQYITPVSDDGANTPVIFHDASISTASGGNVGFMNVVEAKDFDGSALPNAVGAEGDAVRLAASLTGVQYSMPVSEDGASTPMVTHDTAISSAAGGNVGFMTMLNARSSQNTAVQNADACRPIANIYGEQVQAGHTWATNSNRSEEIDPVDEHYGEEELIDTTDIAAATNYYPSSTGKAMGNFNNMMLHLVGSGGVTVTVEAKIDDSTDWADVTLGANNLITNTHAASYVDTSGMLQFKDLWVRNVRVKVVTSDATNGVQLHWKLTAL